MIVNKAELAEIVGKTQQTLTTWQNNGMPIKVDGKRGGRNEYETKDVIAWMLRREISKLTTDASGKVHDYDAERARLTHHQANKTSLEEEVLRGSLIPAETVESVQSDMVASFRARILAIPTRAAHSVIGLDSLAEVQQTLRELVYEALNELSEYRPAQYGIENLDKDSRHSSAAPEHDSKSVGGRKAQAIE